MILRANSLSFIRIFSCGEPCPGSHPTAIFTNALNQLEGLLCCSNLASNVDIQQATAGSQPEIGKVSTPLTALNGNGR
jgi:hypothetical protein